MSYRLTQHEKDTGIPVQPQAFRVTGNAAEYAARFLTARGLTVCEDGFALQAELCSCERTAYIEPLSRLTREKYFLTVTADGIRVEAADECGIFRALCTLYRRLLEGTLTQTEIADYPLFAVRGYIEGFYGKAWTHEERVSVMQLMALHGMNCFYYAPKDDVYHREKWRETYPQKELLALQQLVETARENQVAFHYCIAPGLNYCYTNETDYAALVNKLSDLYRIGVRNFGLLLDDIPEHLQYEADAARYTETVQAHIALINRLYKDWREKDAKVHLTVCPTEYHGEGNEYTISLLGQQLPADVSIFWTGAEICSRVLTVREADAFRRSTGHLPLYWDNFPVNDCEMRNEMHLGALTGRDRELYRHAEGLISNVMEYAACSCIPLLTIADYLWNPLSYDPVLSLERAQQLLLGKEDAVLFRYFSDHLGVSCLSKYSSAYMSERFQTAWFLLSAGKREEAISLLSAYTGQMHACSEMLAHKEHPLYRELSRWAKKFEDCCGILDLILARLICPDADNRLALQKALDAYCAESTALTGFCLYEAATKVLQYEEEPEHNGNNE